MASDLCELQASQPDLLPQYIEQALVVAMTCDDGAYHAIVIFSDMLWDILRRKIVIWTAKLQSLWYLMTCCDWVHDNHFLTAFPIFATLVSLNMSNAEVMQKNSLQWLELFLHFADVSNPLKPFPAWGLGETPGALIRDGHPTRIHFANSV